MSSFISIYHYFLHDCNCDCQNLLDLIRETNLFLLIISYHCCCLDQIEEYQEYDEQDGVLITTDEEYSEDKKQGLISSF